MSVANVSVAWMPDGEIYAYACFDGCLARYHANGSGTGAVVQLKPTSISPKSQRPLNAVVGPPAAGSAIAPCHLFYRQPSTNNIWHVLDNGMPDAPSTQPVTPAQVGVGGTPVQMMSNFGAVATGDGVILVGAQPGAPATLSIVTLPWAALDPATWMQGAQSSSCALALAEGDKGSFDPNDTDIACDVITNPTDGSNVLLIVDKRKFGKTASLDSWWAPIGSGPAVSPLNGTPAAWTAGKISFPKVQVRPDNMALAYYIDDKGVAQCFENTVYGLIGDPANGGATTPWSSAASDEAMAVVGIMSKGASKFVNYGGNAFEVVFGCGAPQTSPSSANPQLTDCTVPVTIGVVYYNGNNRFGESYSPSAWGVLARRGLPVVDGSDVLMGIIEGPPPIPNENLNMSSNYDPALWFGYPGNATTTFAGTSTRQESVALTWSAGLVLKATAKVTVGADVSLATAKTWVEGQVSVSAKYKGAYNSTQTTQSVTTVVTSAEIQGGGSSGQPYSVQAAGTLVMMQCGWTGYSYDFEPQGGPSAAQSVTLYAITPTNISLVSNPYLMNPDAGPTPGVLIDYVLTPDEQAALSSNSIIDLGQGTGFLTASWAYNSKVVPAYASTSSTSWSHGFTLGLDATLGFGAKASLFGNGAEAVASVGVSLAFEAAWTTTDTQSLMVGTEVWLRGNSQAPGSYTAYAFYIYLLERSEQWTTDLLSTMVTPTFPSNPYELAAQQRLHDSINTSSQPWKLCYAVDPQSLFFNEPVTMALQQSQALAQRYAGPLEAAGVTTTQQLDDLLADARGTSGGGSSPPFVSVLDALRAAPADVAALQVLVDAASRVTADR